MNDIFFRKMSGRIVGVCKKLMNFSPHLSKLKSPFFFTSPMIFFFL